MTLDVSAERFENLSRCYTQVLDLEAHFLPLCLDETCLFRFPNRQPKEMWHPAISSRN